jgi:hypothetical protein
MAPPLTEERLTPHSGALNAAQDFVGGGLGRLSCDRLPCVGLVVGRSRGNSDWLVRRAAPISGLLIWTDLDHQRKAVMDPGVTAPLPFVRDPGAGASLDVLGVTHIYKATADETAGSASLWEAVIQPCRSSLTVERRTRMDCEVCHGKDIQGWRSRQLEFRSWPGQRPYRAGAYEQREL